jgi:hypothetical protein
MTFHHLAEMILRQTDKPLTANEIWQQAVQEGRMELTLIRNKMAYLV